MSTMSTDNVFWRVGEATIVRLRQFPLSLRLDGSGELAVIPLTVDRPLMGAYIATERGIRGDLDSVIGIYRGGMGEARSR